MINIASARGLTPPNRHLIGGAHPSRTSSVPPVHGKMRAAIPNEIGLGDAEPSANGVTRELKLRGQVKVLSWIQPDRAR